MPPDAAPLVIATTGLSEAQQAEVQAAGQRIPLVWAPNMSLAVNLALKLAEVAASALTDKDADVEIVERHHRFKEDAPSGTALKFGQRIAAIMGQALHRHGRSNRPGARPHAEIGYHAVRAGDNPGEHTILFGMLGETLELTVRATNRDCYARGALTAAKFLLGKNPGLYSIRRCPGPVGGPNGAMGKDSRFLWEPVGIADRPNVSRGPAPAQIKGTRLQAARCGTFLRPPVSTPPSDPPSGGNPLH